MTQSELSETLPVPQPTAHLLWTATVDVEDRIDLGATANGHRFMVPITGGSFEAGPHGEGLSGTVLPGGADRQFLRPDGVKELDAIYEMQIHDGPILSIQNRVIVDEQQSPERYAMSVISVRAPEGKFDWLNRRLIVGTLQTLRPTRRAVVIRAWMVTPDT